MPIAVQCAKCERRFRAPDSAAGKTRTCPECGSTMTIPPPESVTVTPERVAEATRESSKRNLWAVGSVAILIFVALAGFWIVSAGESERIAGESIVSEPTSPESATQQPKPFEYRILREEWRDASMGNSVTVKVQVADDVAPKVTEADLESLVPIFTEKYYGSTFFIYFYTETPLTSPWGRIIPSIAGSKMECEIDKYVFEMGPWYFPDRIDPNTEWHEDVWLTLPMVNKIVNGATQYEWKVTRRDANAVYFDSRQSSSGAIRDDMNLSPQTWEITTRDGDVPRFVRLVESSLNHLDYEFSQKLIGKLNSVIGNQEYLSGDKKYWTWMFGRLEVAYHHYDGQDMITIMQTAPPPK